MGITWDDVPAAGAKPAPGGVTWDEPGVGLPSPPASPGDGKRKPLQAGGEILKSAITTGLPYAFEKAADVAAPFAAMLGPSPIRGAPREPVKLTPEEDAAYRARLQASAARQEQLLPGGAMRPSEVENIGDVPRFLGENAAVSGARAGATVLGVIGGAAVGGPGGGAVGGTVVGAPIFMGTNVASATEGGEKSLTGSQAVKSIAAAPAQAALDTLIGKYIPGLGKLLPGPAISQTGGIVARTAKHAAGAAATEAVTEAAQQVGERYAAEKDLLSPEARQEYTEAAITGGALGGVLGGATGPFAGKPRESDIDPERPTGAAQPVVAPQAARQPAEIDETAPVAERQQDLFELDEVLDAGIAPVETAGKSEQVSEDGARGKYQLLPSTAQQMARRLGIKYDPTRLLKDEAYNRQLAREYLRTLSDKYDGDTFLAVTAYHAGEGNVDKWVERFGYDPSNQEAFLDQIAKAGNPRSAAYPRKVLAAMGRGAFGPAAAADMDLPADLSDLDLSSTAILGQLRASTIDDEGAAAPADASMNKLAAALSSSLGNADMDAAQAAVERERNDIAKRLQKLVDEQTELAGVGTMTQEEIAQAQGKLDAQVSKLATRDRVLTAAEGMVSRYISTIERATSPQPDQQDLFARRGPPPLTAPATPTTPTLVTQPDPAQRFGRRPTLPAEPQPTGLVAEDTQLAEQIAGEELADEAQQETAAANRFSAADEARRDLLDMVLRDDATRDPGKRFSALLKRVGQDGVPTAEEEARIERYLAAREAFTAAPEEEFAGPDESGNFGIPERKPRGLQDEGERPIVETSPAESGTPDTAPEARVETNVKARAEARAEQLGSSQRAWFLKGVDQAMGTATTPAPTQPSKARWFKMGQDFVAEEKATQEREAGVAKRKAAAEKAKATKAARNAEKPEPDDAPPKPTKTRSAALKEKAAAKAEPAPKTRSQEIREKVARGELKMEPLVPSRGSRTRFDEAVAKAEQANQITPREGVQLRAMAEAAWDPGMWDALDTAVAEHQGARGRARFSQTREAEPVFVGPGGEVSERVAPIRQLWQKEFEKELDRLGLQDVDALTAPRAALAILYNNANFGGVFTYADVDGKRTHFVDIAFDTENPLLVLHHEAMHALRELNLFTDSEWRALVDYARDRYTNNRDGLRDFLKFYDNMGLTRADLDEELVAETFTQWMNGHPADVPATARTALEKIKAFIDAVFRALRTLGRPDAIKLMEAVAAGEIGGRPRGLTRSQEGFAFPGKARIEGPAARQGAMQRAGKAVDVSAKELAKKGHLWLAGTEDIANMAKGLIPSAQRLIELHSNNFALGRDFQERLLEIKNAYQSLPARFKGTAKGSVSEFLYDSRMAGEWGFQPDYQPKAKVSPDLERRFKAMPKAAQDVVKSVFRFNHEARQNLYDATLSAIDAEYDPLIADASTPDKKKEMQASKDRAAAHFSRTFDTQDGLPYTPLKREGRWAVVGSSPEYRDAKQTGDQKTMDKLRSDPAHYYVDFRDTAAEAEALGDNVRTRFGQDGTMVFERGDPIGIDSSELHVAFQQLRKAIEGETTKGSRAAKELHRLATDLYLHSLSEGSARKAELGAEMVPAKDPVTGEVMDMMKAFVTRGEATTNYISSIANNADMQATLHKMREELSATEGPTRKKAARFYNELMWRYTTNLGHRPNRTIDKITRAVSVWNLLSSPFYYIQNATQAVLISQPVMAGRFGYAKSQAALARAYKDFAAMTKDTSVLDRVDFRKAPSDVRDMVHRLADRGRLDAGFAYELGQWEMNGDGILPTAWNKADRFLRMMPARIEVMNRVTTGIAAYRLGKQQGMSDDAAFQVASKLIYDTHGDYSGFNSPRPFAMTGNVGKIILQFRKFQAIMASLVAREFHRAFKGATRQERIMGLKAIGFLSAHMAAIGGIVGMPAASLLGAVVGHLLNLVDEDDDKDWSNWKEDLRKAMGAGGEGEDRNWFADLLFKGAPYALMGMDVSDRLGMGNILALAPYSDLDEAGTSREKMYETIGKVMLGPSGGILAKAVDGWGFAEQGDWTRFAENVAPGVAGNTIKASRLKGEGVTNRAGDTLLDADEISAAEAFYTALGVTPRQLANQRDARSAAFKAEEHYSRLTTKLKRQYAAAAKAGAAAELAEVKAEWAAVQDARERDGFKRQPLSTLLKAQREQTRREARVVEGVPTTPANRGFVLDMMFEDTP